MSQEYVQMVRRLVDAWNRQDLEGILALTDPEGEYVNAEQLGAGPDFPDALEAAGLRE